MHRTATSAASQPLIEAIRRALRRRADPDKAGPMQAYMKSAMPYLGVQTPALRAACREVFAQTSLDSLAAWQDTVFALWRSARHREERYAAIELTGYRRYRQFQTMQVLPLYEEIIVTGAWWDYVDIVATQRLGTLLRLYPRAMRRHMRAWAKSDNIWKRRSAILCQLKFKSDTDLGLLYDSMAPSLGAREFFLRKAIGWALREYAKTDPTEVVRYVRACGDSLSPLSRREALKNVAQRSG